MHQSIFVICCNVFFNRLVHLVRNLLDEIFGSENFISLITFVRSGAQTTNLLANNSDYLLWYGKNKEVTKYRTPYINDGGWASRARDQWVEHSNGSRARVGNNDVIPDDAVWFTHNKTESASSSASSQFGVRFQGVELHPKRGWSTNKDGFRRLERANRLLLLGKSLRYVVYHNDFPLSGMTTTWTDTYVSGFGYTKTYVVETSAKVIQRCLIMTTDPGDIVLDPTMGSGTTAYVAEQWARRWITIDTSRVAIALARTRLMSARYPYYILADSPAGDEREAELNGILPEKQSTGLDIRKGFAYNHIPRVNFRDIVQNEEIYEIYERWQEEIETLRYEINGLLNVEWQEWEVPREIDDNWQAKVKDLLVEYWELRQARQAEIDNSVERASGYEILYDQPYEDKSKVRVTGAFTVESLSPHRFITDENQLRKQASDPSVVSDYEEMILENLLQSGVQNTVQQERLVFENIEPYASTHIQAVGNFTDSEDKPKRAAIYIGSEHGTVSPQQLQEAAKEAVKGVGFDMLIVCGFAFDPHVSEESTRYGNLQVLITRMNPDLAMGADLKTTKTGNLFMVFGEPDIEIRDAENGQKEVELFGLDVYDPTTGELRPRSTDDIACWFIDTDYDEESFFVRHAYFTGADKPYDQLKRTLRSEIDEEAWEMLYRTISMPFDSPERGKIAIKVINHYGDEVLKVYDV